MRPGDLKDINIPSPWSGRVWARRACSNDGGRFHCNSADCGSGQVECNGAGAAPATLAEFTINGKYGLDYYDVSLVDGFNIRVSIVPQAPCETRSCLFNINSRCPPELIAARNGAGVTIGCESACVKYGSPEYCCTGSYDRPTCPPTRYSMFFKNLCPQAYSYAKDDQSSTSTCNTGVNYHITFCP